MLTGRGAREPVSNNESEERWRTISTRPLGFRTVSMDTSDLDVVLGTWSPCRRGLFGFLRRTPACKLAASCIGHHARGTSTMARHTHTHARAFVH